VSPARGAGMRIHLVSMPFTGLRFAPLALSQVRGTIARTHPGAVVTEHFAAIGFAEYLLEVTGGRITPDDYGQVADFGIQLGLGDWVFAGALHDDDGFRVAEMKDHAAAAGADIRAALEMRPLAAGFVSALAAEIAADRPDIVGLTTTFMQNVPSLALAKRVKELSPGTVIILGGANCDGPMGAALARNYPWVGYVVRGEAELVLPLLLDRIAAGGDGAGLDGVCWRDAAGNPVANDQEHPAVPAELIAEAGYDAWHEAFSASPVRDWVTPYLVLQGSRGCWWGAKHHCTFCGIPDATISYRARPADRLWHEMTALAARYRILDVITADNIISPEYYRDLLPRMREAGYDFRVHYEAKANVSESQIRELAAAGLVMIQFGIENFSSRVLKLMDKGLTGAAAVRVLRDAATHGVSVEWNYLYGFPGETAADYENVIGQMPALVHLQPPGGSADRIELERFSPYFENPALGFTRRRPADFYRLSCDLDEAELADLAYFFTCSPAGIGEDTAAALDKELAGWAEKFPRSFLTAAGDGGTVTVTDRREGWPRRDIVLDGWQAAAHEALRRPRDEENLGRVIAGRGAPAAAGELRPWLDRAREQGLVFRDDSPSPKYVALATGRTCPKMAAR
jgi:ribosomal peptide maturation radical SAM protein 1